MRALSFELLRLLWQPIRLADPYSQGQYGVVGRLLREELDMRKSYRVSFTIDSAVGRKIKKYGGAYGGGIIYIDAVSSSFDDPVGKTFLLSGLITKIFNKKNKDITNSIPFDLAFDDIPWQYVNSSFDESGGNRLVDANLVGNISSDWKVLTDLRVTVRGKGLTRIIVKDALVTGSGTLQDT